MSADNPVVKESLTPQDPQAGDLLHGSVRNVKCWKCDGSGIVWKDHDGRPSEIETCHYCRPAHITELWGKSPECANCKWTLPVEGRYDHLRCCNQDSEECGGDVEATGTCDKFSFPNGKDDPR